jgi:hypothetical protein
MSLLLSSPSVSQFSPTAFVFEVTSFAFFMASVGMAICMATAGHKDLTGVTLFGLFIAGVWLIRYSMYRC